MTPETRMVPRGWLTSGTDPGATMSSPMPEDRPITPAARPPLHIVIPTMGLSRSGGDRVLIELANRLARKGHIVTVLVSRSVALKSFPIDPVVRLEVSDRRRNLALELAWLAARVPVSANVVVANYYPTALSVFATSLLRPIVPTYLIQGYEPDFFRFSGRGAARIVKKWAALFTYLLPLQHVYVSTWLHGKVSAIRATAPVVVNNGVDTATFMPERRGVVSDGGPVIMFLGSLGPNKGSDLVVAALNRLAEDQAFKVLLVTQAVEYRPIIKAPVEIFAPRNDAELAQCYSRADVFVFASLQEGFGLPPLEAMACGATVVCSACGGVDDFVRDEENCLKVPAGSAGALHAALERLLKDKVLRQRLAAAGLATAHALTWARTAESYEQVFESAVERHRILVI